VSKESRKAAREFTLKHKLSIAVENDLARLLESVWQDGVNAEQTFNLVEGMVKLVYATCRHCGHKFIPRVEQPRQCGNCWGLAPLRDTPSNKKNGPVSETRKKEHGK
jgi:hypothetical protein